MEFLEKNTNNGNDNFKNVILIIIILIFSYFIERRFPQSIIKNIYFFLAFIIIVGFILNYFFQNFFNKFKEFIKPILRKFPFFSFEEMKEDYNNKKLKKIKEVYQSGYLYNQKNNYINNNILINQNLNVSLPNYFQINENNAIENDKYLAKKIANIDKINKPFEKEYSIKNYVFYASNNNNNFNNLAVEAQAEHRRVPVEKRTTRHAQRQKHQPDPSYISTHLIHLTLLRFIQLPVQRPLADAQHLRRPVLVAATFRQHPVDVFTLVDPQIGLQRQLRVALRETGENFSRLLLVRLFIRRAKLLRRRAELVRQVIHPQRHPAAIRQGDDAPQRILQFAHIARPVPP